MREIKKIILHTSDSPFGCVNIIDKWHKERGFDEVGYHFVIQNGYPFSTKEKFDLLDGMIECGRPIEKIGAHAQGDNSDSIGICLIGKGDNPYSKKQYASLFKLLKFLLNKYNLKLENAIGHYETDHGREIGKTCPNIDMINFRKIAEYELKNEES